MVLISPQLIRIWVCGFVKISLKFHGFENVLILNKQCRKKMFWCVDIVLQYKAVEKSQDPDRLTGLVQEVIPEKSCLIFCATKKNCENVAELLCRLLPRWVECRKLLNPSHIQTVREFIFLGDVYILWAKCGLNCQLLSLYFNDWWWGFNRFNKKNRSLKYQNLSYILEA